MPLNNSIQTENALPGTDQWQLSNPVSVQDRDQNNYRTRLLEGFASTTSVNIGGTITFYVSTTSPTFTLELFRMGYYGGLGGRRMPEATWANIPGLDQPMPKLEATNGSLIACHWKPCLSFTIPMTWVSGIFLGKLTENKTGKQSYIIFVVRDERKPSAFLFQSSVTTFQAYNCWGGKSNYAYNSTAATTADKLSFDRPYACSISAAGIYGNGAGHFFTFDSLPWAPNGQGGLGTIAGWEYNMVRWLEHEGYDLTYCTNIDVHENSQLLLSHKGVLSVGHDEYWSRNMRLNVENARDLGVNLAFFSGNTVWNMVRLEPNSDGIANRTMVFKDDFVYATFPPSYAGGFSVSPNIGWPEGSLVGGTWLGGSFYDNNLTIQPDCPSWMVENTGLAVGDVLSQVAGYEVNWVDPQQNPFYPPGMKVVFISAILATDPLSNLPQRAQSIWYTCEKSGATVFCAATVQWSWGLDDFTVKDVAPIAPPRPTRVTQGTQLVTKNILNRFLDSTRMEEAALADGEYAIASISAGQSLSATNNGEIHAPVELRNPASNEGQVWTIAKYRGGQLDSRGPYKAAVGTVWYTIRNKHTRQYLIVANNGQPNGPVQLWDSPQDPWAALPGNLQKMWRIWRFMPMPTPQQFIMQNVASGQLLIVDNNGVPNSPVIVFGDNGGWGEIEYVTQKMWGIKAI